MTGAQSVPVAMSVCFKRSLQPGRIALQSASRFSLKVIQILPFIIKFRQSVVKKLHPHQFCHLIKLKCLMPLRL